MFTVPMVEILLCVIPVICMDSFLSSRSSLSMASTLNIFMSTPVSTKNFTFECRRLFVENSTTGDSRLSLMQGLFVMSVPG